MRAAVLRQAVIRPEVFAFSTSLTRPAVLSHRSAEVALERANARVTDRYGGTSSAAASPRCWLTHALGRMRRRAELLVGLNPRAAHTEFQPLAGSMAAALPYCDLFLPAHSLTGLRELLLALAYRRSITHTEWSPRLVT